MSFRITRGASPLLLSTILGAVISCAGEQQPPAPAAQVVQDTTIPPHLRAFAMDTAAPFIAVVRNDLAHVLEQHRDKSIVATAAPITDTLAYRQSLQRSLARVDTLLGGRLIPRLASVGFDVNITASYAGVQWSLATASPSWEANDEQDLIGQQGADLVYSGTRAIYTTNEARTIDTDAEFETSQFHRLAKIENWGAQPAYDPLGLPVETDHRVHCLYVSMDRAFLWSCTAASYPVLNPPITPTMEVKRTRHSDREVPPVSRWEWSRQAAQNTIGVRCGKAWCQIAKNGFPKQHHEPTDLSVKEPDGKHSHVLGWYDLQVLAMPSSTGGLEPRAPRGLIRPLAALEEFNGLEVKDSFVTVVEVKLYAGPVAGSKYDVWGLKNGYNDLAICHGSKDACKAGDVVNESVCVANTGSDGRRWYLHIKGRGASDPGVYRCLSFHKDANGTAEFPSTTRWLWLPRDEGMWIRCPQGCCQVN